MHFSMPTISSERARDYQDNESDDDSYGSLLTTGTDVSAMTTKDTSFNEMPVDYQYPTYAAAAMASTTSTEDTQISSPTNSTYPEWQKEKQELEDQIKKQALMIEKIQGDLETKISRSQDLEDQLAQAIELAHSRDKRHEEMLAKFELLMNNNMQGGYNSGRYTPYDSIIPVSAGTKMQDKEKTKLDLPPPKKANTNSSPTKAIYSLFRQQTNKTSNRHQSNRTAMKRHNQQDTQPMDTDDKDQQQPDPGDATGHQEE